MNSPHHKRRSTLPMQILSHWAPICVVPYSQANILRSRMVFLADQIGLLPETMRLVSGWNEGLKQSWKNASSVLDALGGDLSDTIGGVVYLGSDVVDRCPDIEQYGGLSKKIALEK